LGIIPQSFIDRTLSKVIGAVPSENITPFQQAITDVLTADNNVSAAEIAKTFLLITSIVPGANKTAENPDDFFEIFDKIKTRYYEISRP
jgi:hypothetical protein